MVASVGADVTFTRVRSLLAIHAPHDVRVVVSVLAVCGGVVVGGGDGGMRCSLWEWCVVYGGICGGGGVSFAVKMKRVVQLRLDDME